MVQVKFNMVEICTCFVERTRSQRHNIVMQLSGLKHSGTLGNTAAA